jgi:uncharacterized protein DUF3515
VLAACGSSAPPPVAVEQPTPTGAARTACTRLLRDLPGNVEGEPRRPTRPEDGFVAAWGDPPVVLRCGVPEPPQLTPTSETVEVNGVEWFLVESRSSYTFITVGRVAGVEVRVPGRVPRTAATAPLVDVAAAVDRDVPRG